MDRVSTTNLSACPSPEISAYIDGELSPSGEAELECHLAACTTCSADLNLQKNFLNVLDHSLDEGMLIGLPKDFTRSVVANAESRVNGLRGSAERRNAALICAALASMALLSFGDNAQVALSATRTVLDKLLAICVSGGHVVYDLALGLSIVVRSLAAKVLIESGSGVFAFVALCVLSLYCFSRLIVRFRRV